MTTLAHEENLRLVLDEASFAALDRSKATAEAEAFAQELTELTLSHEAERRPRKRARRAEDAQHFNEAIAALAADLVSHSGNQDAQGYLYRPMNREELADTLVSSDAFEKLRLNWGEMGWIEETSFAHYNGTIDEDDDTTTFRRAKRYRATTRFLAIAQSHQITPETVSEHFNRNPKHANLIQVRAAKSGSHGNAMAGRLLKPKDNKYDELREGVAALNRQLERHHFSLRDTPRLRRVFNNGDQPRFHYNFGGRFYCASDDNWMQMPKEKRGAILIDNAPVAEIDVSASHLSILYAKCGLHLDKNVDPYEIKGIPREIVKSCVVAFIGNGGPPTRWPKLFDEKYTLKNGYHPRDKFKLKDVICELQNLHPVLGKLKSGKLDWAIIQFEEAECFRLAMEGMMIEKERPCLPVHDSLLVHHHDEFLGVEQLWHAYQSRLGFRPRLSVTRWGDDPFASEEGYADSRGGSKGINLGIIPR